MKNDNKSINLSMLADYYEFTMANGYIANGVENTEAVFDMFFRKVPDNGGFAICALLMSTTTFCSVWKFFLKLDTNAVSKASKITSLDIPLLFSNSSKASINSLFIIPS